MNEIQRPTQVIQAELENGQIIYLEATLLGNQKTAVSKLSFSQVESSVRMVSEQMVRLIEDLQPDKGSIEFGVEFALEGNNLTALLVKGSAKASLKIILEWSANKAEKK